ncbi:putative transcription factor tau subunit sfc9 [Aplysia californica]|uniref:Transcription factor tau subunit sfc9 n=1 Tax=Aplysia californica TaxID=6500 RepID=A0ABM1A4N1_APLCA|nr:putative transcription factor tau subunit sfc9 [Aplysia californica]
MAQEFCMEVLSLREDVSKAELIRSRKSISCSKDNHLVLCGASTIFIIEMTVSTDSSPENEVLSVRMCTTPQITSLERFSFPEGLLNAEISCKHISEEHRQQLIIDPSLYAEFFIASHNSDLFVRALPSPTTCNSSDRPLLAALTQNHRIIFYEEGVQEWVQVVEMSDLIKAHMLSGVKTPIVLGKRMSFEEYVNLAYGMSTTEMAWSSVFCPEESSDGSFYLFFTGMRNGLVHVWKISTSLGTRQDVEFSCTHKGDSEVTSMCWHSLGPHSGLLAVGQLNGSLYVLDVRWEENDPGQLKLDQLFSDERADDLPVSSLDWSRVDQDTTALVACKEYYVLMYAYSHSGRTATFCSHERLDCSLPLQGISLHNGRGVISSLDSHLYGVNCCKHADKVKMSVFKMKPLALPLFAEIEFLCYGCTMSANGMFALSVHRPNRNLPRGSKKMLIDTYKVTLTMPFSFSKSVVSSLTTTAPESSVADILICLRQHVRDLADSEDKDDLRTLYQTLRASDDLRVLQVLRDMLTYTGQFYRRRRKQELEWVKEASATIFTQLLLRYVTDCYSKLPLSPSPQDLTVLNAMRLWASGCGLESSVPAGLVKLDQKFSQVREIPVETCSVCGGNLQVDNHLLSKCSKGHKVRLCSLTFLPCQGRGLRYCHTCGHPALGRDKLAELSVVSGLSMCSLCGGYLRARFV